MKLHPSSLAALAFTASMTASILAGCSPVGGYCAAAAECDDFEAILLDEVGESNDSDEVCVANNEGLLRTLRANEEDGCFEEAAATERWFACVADTYGRDEGDACDGFTFNDDRNPCFDELDDMLDLRADNGDNCSPGEE